MMKSLKRISVISLWMYLVFLPVSVLVPHEPILGTFQAAGIDGGFKVTGEVHSDRVGVHIFSYNRPICVKVQRFSTTVTGDKCSSSVILKEIATGENLKKAQWKVNWDAVVLAYFPVWVTVGFVYWIAVGRSPEGKEKQVDE